MKDNEKSTTRVSCPERVWEKKISARLIRLHGDGQEKVITWRVFACLRIYIALNFSFAFLSGSLLLENLFYCRLKLVGEK